MKRSPITIERYIDKKLEQIGGAGTLLGRILGSFGRHASKVLIGLGVLLIFGVAVFLWSVVQGMGKKEK